MERDILILENRQKEITAKLEEPGTYEQSGEAMKLNRELIENATKLEQLNETWNEASAEVANLNPTPEPAI